MKTRHHLSGWLYINRFFIVKLIRGFVHLQAIKNPISFNKCAFNAGADNLFLEAVVVPFQLSNYAVNTNINYGYFKSSWSFNPYDDYCNKSQKITKIIVNTTCSCFFLWLKFDANVKTSWEKNITSFKGENNYYTFFLSTCNLLS